MYDSKNSENYQQLEVNREKICPFLLRVFYRENEFNPLEDFNNNNFPTNRELHIYTWMDANLRELTMLIKDAVDMARKKDAVLNFSFVFYDSRGRLQRKEVGTVYANKKCADEIKSLHQLKFVVGDYIDICINTK
jgi:histone deacetylase complex subunit SAP18